MTRLDTLIERARNTPVSRDSAARYIRDLHRRATSRSTVGDAIGSYKIVRKIGKGGMGVVYLATHSVLGRPAAVKVLLPELSLNRDMVGRFFNEARAAASIRHPGIVDLYDFGFAADGSGYIAMELLEGETLRSRLRRRGRLPVGAAIEIGRQIAAALQAAHDKGITHRDLKPDNVFLAVDPEIAERVKLLDFGIAKLVNEAGGTRTQTGVVMGTPVYMSPEQCRGAATLDSRADLYSLGCVLYELVAGRPPFVADSAGDIMAHHLYFQPDPVRSHDASVPESLDALIMALLAKDPAMRPASAAEVSAILDSWRSIAASASSNAMRAAPGVAAAATVVRPVGPIVAATPTTLSGAAAAVAAPAGPAGSVGSRSRSLRRAAIGAAVVATGAIALLLATRQPEPTATGAAAAPSLVEPEDAPAAPPIPPLAVVPPAPLPGTPPSSGTPSSGTPSPAAPSPAAPPPAAPPPATPPLSPAGTAVASLPGDAGSPPSTDRLAQEPPPRKPARVAASAKPVAAPTKKAGDAAAAAPAPRDEPKAAAASTTQPVAPAAATPEAKPTPAPAPAAEISQKTEPTPAQPTAPAKPAVSKWGHLMGDKRLDGNNLLLLEQCKVAATRGDCATARNLAARIADKNVAMYRARVITDAAIAACLSSK
jgi:hypothetical protein